MYSFVDAVASVTDLSLPAEAMQYDGIYLENEIPGYRTLHVSGRELMTTEMQDQETDSVDGAHYYGKRYPPRTITVTYYLAAKTNTEFREAYNKLNLLLRKEQVQVIFADEPDKYFIGTKAGTTDPEPGRNAVTGEIEIYCSDPRKYSTVEKVFEAAENEDGTLEVTINNDGTEDASVSYEIVHGAHDNGYIGIVSEYGVIQLGKEQEADGETYQQNENLLGIQTFINAQDDHGTNYMHPNHDMRGTLNVLSGDNYQHLAIGNMGTGQSGKWCGGMRTVSVPADSAGVIGARNFRCYINWWFETGLMGQTAEQSIAFLTSDNKVICGYSLYKTDMTGNTAALEFWLNEKAIERKTFTPSLYDSDNPFNFGRGHQDIRKEGDKVTFYWFGSYIPYVDTAVKDLVCTKIQVAFTQYYGRNLSNQYVTRNYLRVLSFQKMNVEKWRDVPNRYAAGDKVTVDGKTTKMYVNGMPRYGDEIIGSTHFKVPPGETKILFPVSTFCDPKPAVRAKIREVYL